MFAGPNGSGKSTCTMLANTVGTYLNADDIKRSVSCTDLDAVLRADQLREHMIMMKQDFTFETVLSTERNLRLLQRAKENGFFVRGIYVLTNDTEVNVMRVRSREAAGGHGVPEEKIRARYHRALKRIPVLVAVCDVLHSYDNTNKPFRIFKKRKTAFYRWENEVWNEQAIAALTGISSFSNGL